VSAPTVSGALATACESAPKAIVNATTASGTPPVASYRPPIVSG
jgi:hypothetical protein